MNAKELLKLGKLLKQEHDLSKRLTALRDKMRDVSHSSSWHANGVSLHIPLPEYLAQFPNVKPLLNEYTRDDGQRRAWMNYPPQFVGWIKPGFALWVESCTPTVDVPATAVTESAQAA